MTPELSPLPERSPSKPSRLSISSWFRTRLDTGPEAAMPSSSSIIAAHSAATASSSSSSGRLAVGSAMFTGPELEMRRGGRAWGSVRYQEFGEQIGRASCRERVCQDVYIWVVAVSLKKKDQKDTD